MIHGTTLFPKSKAYYLPVIGQGGVLGVIGIGLTKSLVLTPLQMKFLDTIAPQIAVVLERERLYEKQEETQIQVQRERLRTDMLRAISHGCFSFEFYAEKLGWCLQVICW